MPKKVPVVKITTPSNAADALAGTDFAGTVGLDDIAAVMRDGLLAMSTAAGLVVMRQMLDTELASIVGPKHAKLGARRVGYHHGTTTGQVDDGHEILPVGGHGFSPGTASGLSPGTVMRFPI